MRYVALVVGLLALHCTSALFAFEGTLRVRLEGGLLVQNRGSADKTTAQNLDLDIACRGGKWLPTAWGFAEYLPSQEHLGQVLDAKLDGDRLELRVKLNVNHNRNEPMFVGGEAQWLIQLQRQGQGWGGSFTGTCQFPDRQQTLLELDKAWGFGYVPGAVENAQPTVKNRAAAFLAAGPVKGSATAVQTEDPVSFTDFSSMKPGMHPRLLFRAEDLPRLRQRAATAEGQKIIAELKELLDRAQRHGFAYTPPAAEHSMGNIWATGHALLYQLTGDRACAQRAADLCLANLYGSYYYGGDWLHAYTVMGIAFSYDMCYEAWDQPTRTRFYSYLEQNVRQMAGRQAAPDYLGTADRFVFANGQMGFRATSVRDRTAAKFRASAAIAALAIARDAPPEYQPPGMADVPTIKPASDYEPWVGVPVEPFEDDVMPRNWLINGPFIRGTTDEIFAAAGGLSAVRPEPGVVIPYEGESLDWRPYRPAGASAAHGGTIYARDCARYWASSTGGGYSPGIRLFHKWRQGSRGLPSINVCLYTVIDNDRERVVQALPNWRSRSIGNRMWIHGQPVQDGQLVRLTKGLYPLMVEVAVIGAYSAQSPKLREYTQRHHAADVASADLARRATGGSGPADNQALQNLMVLTRSVRRYIPADIGVDGWKAWDTQETMLPLLLAYRGATGVDMAGHTPLGQLLPLSVRLRGHGRSRALDYAVSQSVAFMPEAHVPVARWYLDHYGRGIARPLDAVIALVTHPLEVAPQQPQTLLRRASEFAGYGVHAFRSGWEGSNDILTLLQVGSPAYTSPLAAGNLTLTGLGRSWLQARDAENYLWANNFSIRDFYPAAAPQVLHRDHAADGSGSVSFEINRFVGGTVLKEKHSQVSLDSQDSGMSWRRAVAVDYSGTSGAPVLLVLADRISGAAFREKVWRFDVGEMRSLSRVKDPIYGVHITGNSFISRPRPDGPRGESPGGTSMRVAFVVNASMEFREHGYGTGRGLFVEAGYDRPVRAAERAIKAGPEAGQRLGGDDALLEELTERQKEAQRRTLPPVTVFTVITLQEKAPPPLASTGEGDGKVITVGGRTIRFDGTKVVLGP